MRDSWRPVFPKTKRIFRQLTDENESAPIYLLAGVTAAGKSQIALNWAEANQSHILSCDSVAVYKGMDIGSAKPSEDEQSRVSHHGIDLAEVDSPLHRE